MDHSNRLRTGGKSVMDFRRATRADIATVITWVPDAESCERWAGPQVKFPLELDQVCEDIELDNIPTYVLDDEGAVLALGQVRMFEGGRGHLSRIIVRPESRGRGIGERFCRELIAEARRQGYTKITLHVIKENAVAIRLYERLGFVIPSEQPSGIRAGIYYMELG